MSQLEIINNSKKLRPAPAYPVYPPYHKGRYIEEYFFDYFIKTKPKLNRIYLPIFWTNLYCNETHNKQPFNIQSFLDALDPNARYFTICQHEHAPAEILPKNTLIFSASGKIHQNNKSNNHIPIPLLCSPIRNVNLKQKRDILCSFIGAKTHKLRESLYNTYKNDADFYFSMDAWKPNVSKTREIEFKTITERSIFALCPRGDGPTSFRLYEVMQLGAIPVYVYDMPWLPNENEVNWSDICILISEGEITHLKDILINVSDDRINKIRENIKQLYPKYFTLEKLSENVISKIQHEKMRLITSFSDSHEVLFNKYFLPTFKSINEYDLIIHKSDQVGDGTFYNDRWKEATGRKLQYLRQAIVESWGDYIVFSDVDIIFFRKTKDWLLNQIQNYDAVFQRDFKEACSGFFMMRCNDATLNLLNTVIDNYDKYPEDQTAINKNKDLIKFNLLPDEIFNISMINNYKRWDGKCNWKIPDNILIFHANWTVGVENKIELFNFAIDSLRHKINYTNIKVTKTIKHCIMFPDHSFFIGKLNNNEMQSGVYVSSQNVNNYTKTPPYEPHMRINVYFNYFIPKNDQRKQEINFCLNKLLHNKDIDRLFLLCSDETDINDNKIIKLSLNNQQPTFKDFFNIANYNTLSDDINIVLNSDCYIEEIDVQLIKQNLTASQIYCLSRWNIHSLTPFVIKHFDVNCSQDAWIFKGCVSENMIGDYKMGMPGCDNAIAYEFHTNGYDAVNPSKDIKIIHYHLSDIRTYGTDATTKEKNRVKKPYKFLSSCKLSEIPPSIKIIAQPTTPEQQTPIVLESTATSAPAEHIIKAPAEHIIKAPEPIKPPEPSIQTNRIYNPGVHRNPRHPAVRFKQKR